MKDQKIQKDNKNQEQLINDLKNKIDQLTEALQRERADAMNVRRRADEDKLKMSNFFKSSIIEQLLPFIEHFDLSISHFPKTESKDINDWFKGLDATHKQLQKSLEEIGLKKIETVGQDFNPEYHEAISMDENAKGVKEVVIEEFRPGYVLGDQVIRHAVVKVGLK